MKSQFPGFVPTRRDRLIQESRHDTYMSRQKPAEPTVCPDCGAVFHDGRWQWLAKPAEASESRCPACHRIHDHFPAGYVAIGGSFFSEHRDELMHLIQNQETREKETHPLKRIMKIEDTDTGVLVTTTDIHLARGIGDALHNAYQGELEYHYNEQENRLRVTWAR